ncbi:unnamed protein product [Diatraea saccharalis]|uniref:Carboxypeptidase n=1 Tax=Diatraea saccharalis TaxID=40085 RepID=A0A9N9QVF8_9NEOP|nr:unnamed protein product [Diatraea saccharalis]
MYRYILLVFVSICQLQAATLECKNHILTPKIKAGYANQARNQSEVDSKNFLGVKSHSGFLTVNEEYNSNLFFWYFPHERQAEVPWIIWLQVVRRNLTWASDYSLLFVDNPVGAGFSFTDDDKGYTQNEDEVGEQLYELLIQFLEIFPELKTAPLFIAGESYAGKYVPALAIQIHRRNRESKESETPINLRGLSIGNGLIDPRSMMHYTELCSVLGLLAGKDLEKLKELENASVTLLDEQRMVESANKFNETIEFIKKKSGVSIYNFNRDPTSSKTPEFELFVTKPEVRRWIHAGCAKFDFNNQLVYTKMLVDFMNTTKPFVEELLEQYGVMCYSGQLDVILPYGGSRYMYRDLHWTGRNKYDEAPRKRLRGTDGGVVGYKKSGGNFVEVVVRGAGHMVPAEEPEVLKFLLDAFIEDFK